MKNTGVPGKILFILMLMWVWNNNLMCFILFLFAKIGGLLLDNLKRKPW